MKKIECSIVTYKNKLLMLKDCINSLLQSDLDLAITVIDNSPSDVLKEIATDSSVRYIYTGSNLGYGKAHNILLRKTLGLTKYNLILNPDIKVSSDTLNKLYDFMEQNKDIGLVMPKVVSPDGKLQYLCKLLPTPLDLAIRRFNPIRWLEERNNSRYELRTANYDDIIDAPSLSGCFMFIRNDIFYKSGFFDEMFFMYMEDIDLCRKINKYARTVYYPETCITHVHAKESYKNMKLLWVHINSAIKYFNKWGWFIDKDRSKANSNTISKLPKSNK